MSDSQFDGLVIGAGHNGLITAAYLAKAGMRIGVIEGRPTVGGGFSTEEVTAPGYHHNLHAIHTKLHESPVDRDLELRRYGVSYVFPNPKMGFVQHDGWFAYYQGRERNVSSIARVSKRDAATYEKVSATWQRWYRDFILPYLYAAPVPHDEWVERVGREPGGTDFMAIVRDFSPVDYARDLFESEFCRMAVVRAVTSAEYNPQARGIPPLVFAHIVNWFAGTTALVRGGSRRVAEGMARIVAEHGGEILLGEAVEHIDVRGGAARGVVLTSGRALSATRFVASSINPVHTFLLLMDEAVLPAGLAERAASFKFKETGLFRVHLALRERPHFAMASRAPELDDAWKLTIGFECLDDLLSMGRQAANGAVPDLLGLDGGLISIHDASQAPPGGCTAYVGIPAPFELADGGAAAWPSIGKDVGERLLDELREFAPNVRDDVIVGRFVYSPKDIEEYLPDMINGDICQGEICLDQLGDRRPWPGMADYRTPVDRLYLCGASTHPGGHAIGGPGYNAANAIANDLGLEKWWGPYRPRTLGEGTR